MSRRPAAGRDLARSDCEHCRAGWVTQPVNTVSSLAYVAAGAALLRRGERDRSQRAVGWAVMAAGVGSVAYHGPGGRLSHWAHDASVIAMLGLVAANRSTRGEESSPSGTVLSAIPAAAALAAVDPRVSALAQVGAGAAVAGLEVHRMGRGERSPAVAATWLIALAAHVLGRSDSPLCRPRSLLQPHAAWHALSALALWRSVR